MSRRKHTKQMSPKEREVLRDAVDSLDITSWDRFSRHCIDRILEKKVSAVDIVETIKYGEIIEAHNEVKNDIRVLLRKVTKKGRSTCVVVSLRDGQIVTCYKNRNKDKHSTLGWSEYQWKVDLVEEVKKFMYRRHKRGVVNASKKLYKKEGCNMKTSQTGIDLIKKFEGCQLKAYLCPAGVWTIGVGHTGGVKQGQVITQKQADDLLRQDVEKFEDAIHQFVKVELNQNQFDALVSWTFNLGGGALQKSDMLTFINKGDFTNAAKELVLWNKATVKGQRVVLSGLVKRREAEKDLFLKSASSAVKPASKRIEKPVAKPKTYTIAKGDTLSGIALKTNVSVSQLKKLNGLKSDTIYPGHVLKLS